MIMTNKTTFADFYYGLRPFYPLEKIIDYCRNSKAYVPEMIAENLRSAKALLLFENGTRRSWLVRSDVHLYKLIDDKKEEKPTINWSVDLQVAQESDVTVVSSGNVAQWKIAFGFRSGKKYIVDPRLFLNLGVERIISEFIQT